MGGMNERGGKNPFQGSSPPLIRKYRQVVYIYSAVPSTYTVNILPESYVTNQYHL